MSDCMKEMTHRGPSVGSEIRPSSIRMSIEMSPEDERQDETAHHVLNYDSRFYESCDNDVRLFRHQGGSTGCSGRLG